MILMIQYATIDGADFLQNLSSGDAHAMRSEHNSKLFGRLWWFAWPILGRFLIEYYRVSLLFYTTAVLGSATMEGGPHGATVQT